MNAKHSRIQPSTSASDGLLSHNQHHSRSNTCIAIAHAIAWLSVIIDLGVMPPLTYTVGICLSASALSTVRPCGCYGYTNVNATAIGNIGVCDCSVANWTETIEFDGEWLSNKKTYECWGTYDSSKWHPQYCPGSGRSWLVAVAVLTFLLFTQYILCGAVWVLWLLHVIMSVLTRIFWWFICIVLTMIHTLWWCINMQVQTTPQQYFTSIYNGPVECFEFFSWTKSKELFEKYLWNVFAPQPEPKCCVNDSMQITMVLRLINIIPCILLCVFLFVVPIDSDELNRFNCDKYGQQHDGNAFEVRRSTNWKTLTEYNILHWLIVVQIVLVPLLFVPRRIVLCILQMNYPDLENNESQRFYLRMIGKKYH
eukprot:52630_1